MSQIVIHGDTVYLAGVVAHQNADKSVTEQTREIVGTIERSICRGRHRQVEVAVGQYLARRHRAPSPR